MRDEEKLNLIGCGIYMGSRWFKQNTIAELEKIKAEAEELIEHCDSDYEFEEIYGIRLVVGILDNRIAELKGENNEI